MKTLLLPVFALLLAPVTPALARQDAGPQLQQRVAALLAEAPAGTRFGLLVVDDAGREIVAIQPDGRFMPASNTKIFTTAAALATLPDIEQPDMAGGATVRIEQGDVILAGRGDARLSSADDCVADCLATLADAVAAKTRRVRAVIGDDTRFPDQRWSPGMSWNNIPYRSGTAASALTLDDNELALRVLPGKAGAAARVESLGYYTLDNQIRTVAAGGATALGFDRAPNARMVRLTGTIAADAAPQLLRMSIDDPAHYAAWRMKALLEARGVRVTGGVEVRHRPLAPQDDPAQRKGTPAMAPPEPPVLAALVPPPLADDLRTINKQSQNLHAELLLRRVSRQAGSGSIADGLAVVDGLLAAAGAARTGHDLSDGSGMSTYNRVSPRSTVALLRWIAGRPWGAGWRATLPVAGTDGTLARRFKGTALEGRLFAKTGTLNATNALSGYLVAKSGRTLTFAAFANDVPADASATRFLDAALLAVADAN